MSLHYLIIDPNAETCRVFYCKDFEDALEEAHLNFATMPLGHDTWRDSKGIIRWGIYTHDYAYVDREYAPWGFGNRMYCGPAVIGQVDAEGDDIDFQQNADLPIPTWFKDNAEIQAFADKHLIYPLPNSAKGHWIGCGGCKGTGLHHRWGNPERGERPILIPVDPPDPCPTCKGRKRTRA